MAVGGLCAVLPVIIMRKPLDNAYINGFRLNLMLILIVDFRSVFRDVFKLNFVAVFWSSISVTNSYVISMLLQINDDVNDRVA